MRKTIIFSALAALFGFVALAQASDHPRADLRGDREIAHKATNGDRDGKHERDARNVRAHERHDEADGERHEVNEAHDRSEAAEHGDRR